ARRRPGGPEASGACPQAAEIVAELLDLVADPGSLLEAEVLGGEDHLLLELDDHLLQLVRALDTLRRAAAAPARRTTRLHRQELGHVGDSLLHRLGGDPVLLGV